MLQKFLRFVFALFLVVGAVYFSHGFILNGFFTYKTPDFFQFCYTFNLGLTFLFTTPIILFGKKFKDQIGFAFLAQGIVKIGLFLYFIHFAGFELNKGNFLVFFVPYLACLVVELFFVFRLLK